MQYGDMKKSLAVGVLFALGVAAFPLYAGGISAPPALTQPVADGLYVKQDGSLDPDMTGLLTIDLAGLPAYLINDTDNASNEVLRLYSNRATPTDGDAAFINFNLNTTTPTETTFGRIAVTAEDATAAIVDGLFSVYLQASSSLTEMFKISALNALAELIDVDLEVGGSVSTKDGVIYAPGSDIDVALATVDVTGTPTWIWDESADNFGFNKGIFVSHAGLPFTATNTTAAAEVEGLRLHHNGRGSGSGVDGDSIVVNFQLDDNASTSIPVRLEIVGDDLDTKTGTWGSLHVQAGSGTFTDICVVDGVNNRLLANDIGLIGAPGTGFSGSADILNWKTDGINRYQLLDSSTSHNFLTGYDVVISDECSVGDELAVGSLVTAMENSAMFQVTTTTLGSIPAPRMTTAQATAIVSKDVGIQVDDTDLNALKRWSGTAFETFVVTRSPITVMFGGGTDPHADTNSTTYTTIGIFPFAGTDALGLPTNIKAIGLIDPSGTAWDFQVLDITNATTIVTKTGNTGTVAELVTAGALSNLPAGAAMFEIQLKRTGGGGATEAHMHSLTVEF